MTGLSATVLLIALLSVGCVTPYREVPDFDQRFGRIRTVTLLPPKVAVYKITAGGVEEEVYEWTESARRLLAAELEREIRERGRLQFVPYPQPTVEDAIPGGAAPGWTPLEENWALFEAVATAVFRHTYDQKQLFAPKQKNFDYTLGADAATLVEGIGADAFLIVVATDYVETAGRTTLIVLGALASVAAGAPVGPAMSPTSVILALVEARTGDILWFNQVASRANLRDPESDAKLVDAVMKGLAEE
jgi:hypothetical protein